VVSPAELPTVVVSALPKEGVTLLDVREDDEWAAGHAPGAKHIPLGELPARVDELAELPEDQPVYVVCRSGGRSARAAAWLNASGWDAVNVDGGMKSWAAEGRRVVTTQPDTEPEIL
jgi:rhodanese-related sulfurtransferase